MLYRGTTNEALNDGYDDDRPSWWSSLVETWDCLPNVYRAIPLWGLLMVFVSYVVIPAAIYVQLPGHDGQQEITARWLWEWGPAHPAAAWGGGVVIAWLLVLIISMTLFSFLSDLRRWRSSTTD